MLAAGASRYMATTVTASGLIAVLRALLPLVLTVCLLVAGLVVTPGSAAPITPDETPVDTREATDHSANVTLYDAGNGSFEDAAAVETAIDDGRVTEPGEMAVNETLVVVIESDRLASAMDDHDGSTTDRFVAALNGPADLYLVQTNPTTMVTRTFALVGADNATAYRNSTTVYALIDTGDVVFRKERTNGTHAVDSLYEDRFAVDFGFDLYEPPWEPPGDPPWGPTFVLSDERFVTPTPEPMPTRTPTDSPTPMQTTDPPRSTGPSTPTADIQTDTGKTATLSETSPSPSANGSGTPTTLHRDGSGFTVGTALVALLSLVLFRRRRR